MHTKTILVATVASVCIALLVNILFPKREVTYDRVQELVSQQVASELAHYKENVATLDKKISALSMKLEESKKVQKSLQAKLEKLQKQKEEITPPGDINEILRRFESLGYHPVVQH